MSELKDYSGTAASNNAEAPNGMKEGILAGSVNNSWREGIARLVRWITDLYDGVITTGGTNTAYTLSPTRTISAYYDGLSFLVKFNATCGASPTLNVSSLGAKSLVWPDGTALAASDIASGARVRV